MFVSNQGKTQVLNRRPKKKKDSDETYTVEPL